MITKHHTVKQITDAGLVAVVRADNIEQAKKLPKQP